MANTSAIWQHVAHTYYHLLAAQQELFSLFFFSFFKAYLLSKNAGEVSMKKSVKWTISGKITRQKEQED